MTLPGASMMEWKVVCGRDLATAKGVPVVTNITYLLFGPEVDNPRDMFKPVFFGLLWLADGSRVSGTTKVLVHTLRDKVHVFLLESLFPFVDEFDLWGIGAFQ